jgi:hypothetical protein
VRAADLLCIVPGLRGRSAATAERRLAAAGCRARIVFARVARRRLHGRVLWTYPRAGWERRRRARVTVTVGAPSR